MTIKPILHFKMEGDAKDSSGNGNDGTVTGATLTEDRFGRPNEAYGFGGYPDKIVFDDELTLGEFTIASIITNHRTVGNGHVFKYIPLFRGVASSTSSYLGIKYVSDGVEALYLETADSSTIYTSSSFVKPTGAAVYLITYDASGAKIYVNGELAGTITASFGSMNIGWIGTGYDSSSMDGIMDGFRLYSTKLTPTQARKISFDMMRKYGRQ